MCCYLDNIECLCSKCHWQKRGKAFLHHSIKLLLATFLDRHEVLVFLVMLKHHLQSSKVGVRNLLSFSISSWLNIVWKNKMWMSKHIQLELKRNPTAVRSGSQQRGLEPQKINKNFSKAALDKLVCLRKFSQSLCLACDLTMLHNSSLYLSVNSLKK